MPIDPTLLRRARENPQGLRFDEAAQLAEQLGFIWVRKNGSHEIYRHPDAGPFRRLYPQPLNLQPTRDGMAKDYQVKQMLAMATAFGRLHVEEDAR